MRFLNSLLVLVITSFLCPATVAAQDEEIVKPADAVNHDGEFVMVCGLVAETTYSRSAKGKPTYLNFTRPYPDHEFVVIVWGKYRKNFDYKPESLTNHTACVYGEVEVRRGRAQMAITIPDQISARPARAKAPATSDKAVEAEKEATG